MEGRENTESRAVRLALVLRPVAAGGCTSSEREATDARLREVSSVAKAKLDAALMPIVKVALLSGMRRNEILRLRWEDVNWNRSELVVTQAKNHEARYIPMNDDLQDTLSQVAKAQWSSEYLFPNLPVKRPRKDAKTRVPFQGNSVTHAFVKAVRKAGIKHFRFSR